MEASPLFLCQSKFGQDPYCGSGTSHISAFAARGTSGRHLGFEEFQIFFQCFQRLMLAFFSFFLVNSFSSLYISIANRFFRDFVVAKMPFDVRCHCSKHREWFHGSVSRKDLRVPKWEELKYVEKNPRNGDRVLKICLACKSRIKVELTLQSPSSSANTIANTSGSASASEQSSTCDLSIGLDASLDSTNQDIDISEEDLPSSSTPVRHNSGLEAGCSLPSVSFVFE